MSYNPNLPPGQAPAATSAPVTVASDVPTAIDMTMERAIHELSSALISLTSCKNYVAPSAGTIYNVLQQGGPAMSATLVGGSSLGSVGNLYAFGGNAQQGMATCVVPNLMNQAYTQSFSNFITRP